MGFIKPIKPIGRFTSNKCIFIAINYATNWMEAKSFWMNITVIITKFLYEYILTRFGCPLTLVTNQGVRCINDVIKYPIDHFFEAC